MELKTTEQDNIILWELVFNNINEIINDYFNDDLSYETIDKALIKTWIYDKVAKKVSYKIEEEIDKILDDREFVNKLVTNYILELMKIQWKKIV